MLLPLPLTPGKIKNLLLRFLKLKFFWPDHHAPWWSRSKGGKNKPNKSKQKLTSVSELDKRAALGVAVDFRNQVKIADNASSRGSPTGGGESKDWGLQRVSKKLMSRKQGLRPTWNLKI